MLLVSLYVPRRQTLIVETPTVQSQSSRKTRLSFGSDPTSISDEGAEAEDAKEATDEEF